MPVSPPQPRRTLTAVVAALVTALLAISIVGAVLVGLNYGRRLSAIRSTVETQRAILELLSATQDAETGQRGYLLTGDRSFLEPYDRARRDLPALLARATSRLAPDPDQARRLAVLRGQIDAKLAELDRTTRLARTGEREVALRLVAAGRGRRQMDAIRASVAALDRREAEQLAAQERGAARIGWLLLALTLVPLVAIPLLIARVSRDLRRAFGTTTQRLDERRVEAERLGRELVRRDVALTGAEDRFSLVLDAATEFGIIVMDTDGVVTRWSRGAEAVFGWGAADAEGRPAHLIFTPEDVRDGVPEAEMRGARENGHAVDERWHLRADGSRFWASGEMQPLKDGDGDLIGYLKIARDRTAERLAQEAERERAAALAARVDAQAIELESVGADLAEQAQGRADAEGQLRQLQKLEGLGQLTAGIAHDFNNMLAVVIGALDLIKRKFGNDNAGLARLVSAAEDGANRATELTKRLLAFSRQQPLQPRVLDLNRLVSGMSEILMRTLGEQVQVETVRAGGLWPVDADPQEIERVLLNLAVNARDAMPGGGKLTIETANAHLDDAYAAAHPEVTAGQYVAICVTDTGTGMPPDVLARAFDPFYSTKAVGQGTGLGLSQAFGFAKQSNGHVKIYSEVGHGTTVRLYLPRSHAAERPTEPRRVEPSMAELPRGRPGEIVLVVEDEERVRMISVETLRDLGYTVRHASNGAEALALVDEQPGISLLFTDIVMPGMTGRELSDRATERQPDIRTLYTTGYTRNAVVHGGVLDAGVAFLPKPFTVEQLAIKVRATIDGRGANR